MSMHRALRLLILVVISACSPAPSPAQRQAVLLVSLDGFRWDYLDRPEAVRLRELAARGVRAERMVQTFPTKTFATHYSMVTGLHPGEHGILANNIWDDDIGERFTLSNRAMVQDSRWWGGEPIWVTAERAGQRTAPYFWPGSEAEIKGVRPTHWRVFDGRVPNARRVRMVLDWLSQAGDSAVTFATLYFEMTDNAGHDHGVDSPEVGAAIAEVDAAIGMLVDGLAERGLADRVNLIVVSDHGMTGLSGDRQIVLDHFIRLHRVQVVDWTPVLALIPEPGYVEEAYQSLKGAHPNLQVYRKGDIPARFHYNDHPRVTPIVAIADEGWTITSQAQLNRRPTDQPWGATHGFDPELMSMGSVFVASGPAFRQGFTVPRVRAIDLYEVMAHILGVVPAPNSGSLDSARIVLRTLRD
ncbi:MAG: ectonucleotide pyrophosphatase/phosphodiesterase [Gemmatimonadales bacterium]|nr:ectonucleotide pyrophosphatase/phosphodiesterase [Gemmatimonadales bacterium]